MTSIESAERPAKEEQRHSQLLRAWAQVSGTDRVDGIDTLQEEKRRSVYRLRLAGGSPPTVIAKRAPTSELTRELPFYNDVLPALGFPSIRVLGAVGGERLGDLWMFMEEATGDRYDATDQVHRVLAGSWIGRFHAAGATNEIRSFEPRDRGAIHFQVHVEAAWRSLQEGLQDSRLTTTQWASLHDLYDTVSAVRFAWRSLDRMLSSFPWTYVHGDFKPDNVMVANRSSGPTLLVFDWNESGRGVPALDLSRFVASLEANSSFAPERAPRMRSRGMSIHRMAPDLDAYLAEVRTVWPDFDERGVRALGLAGELFHCVATIRWEAARLSYPWVQDPMGNLDTYREWLEALWVDIQPVLEPRYVE